MEKSAVKEFFLDYFEKTGINTEWISEKTGIDSAKLSKDYRKPLTATEFLDLCAFLKIEPETVNTYIRQHSCE